MMNLNHNQDPHHNHHHHHHHNHLCIQQPQNLNKNLQNDHINYNGAGAGGDGVGDYGTGAGDAGNIKENQSFCCCCCNINVNDYVNNGNLFLFCCIAACLSLISYLIAFSCEVSWILEAKGNLPTISYLLCSGYFLMFIASTILIHGLATGLSWGLFSWSIVIGTLSIPELCFVMIMTTQYWGLQSTHGLTELIGYLIRLIINCLALLCVIPTALKWKRQKLLLSQLEGLASRLQISTPLPQSPTTTTTTTTTTTPSSSPQNIVATTNNTTNNIIINQNNMNKNDSLRRINNANSRRGSCFDNPAFINTENQLMEHHQQLQQQQKPFNHSTSSQILYGVYPNVGFSPNEFNASIFGLDPSQYIGPPFQYNPSSKRTQSLLDLRYVLPNTQIIQQQQQQFNDDHRHHPHHPHGIVPQDVVDGEIGHQKRINFQKKYNIEYTTDPIYQTISSEKSLKSLGRNCISLENLERIEMITTPTNINNNNNNNTKNKNNNTTIKNFNIKNNVLENYNALFMLQGYPIGYHQQFPIQYVNYPNNPQSHNNFINTNTNMNMNMNQQIQHHSLSQQHLASSQSLLFNGYGGFGGYTNPNPYNNRSNTNSKQSLGNESDDYRRYRDVAL